MVDSVILPAHAQTSSPQEESDPETDSVSETTVSCSGTYQGTISGGTPLPCGGNGTLEITIGPAPDRTLVASLNGGIYAGNNGNYNPDGSFGPVGMNGTLGAIVIEGNIAADCSQITGQTLPDLSTVCGGPPGNFTLILDE